MSPEMRHKRNFSFAQKLENSFVKFQKLDFTQLKRNPLQIYSDVDEDSIPTHFISPSGMMLHSQRILMTSAPEYIKRNSSFLQMSPCRISIYLHIHRLFEPQNSKDLPKFQEFMINVEKTLYYLQD